MARIGVMTTEFDLPTFEETADCVVRHGIDTVQLQLGSVFPAVPTRAALLQGLDVLGGLVTSDVATRAHEVLAARGLEVAAVDGTYNMAHPDPVRRTRDLGHLVTLIELAPAFGTDLVTLCTGSRADVMWEPAEGNRSAEAWRDLVAQLEVAVPVAERVGVRLAFEPEHNNVVDSAPAARRLMDELASPALKVVLDGANLFHAGDLARMSEHLSEIFDLVGADIVLAHAKDLDHDGDAGGRAAGQGRLDYGHYLAGLQAHGFDGAIILHQLAELLPDHADAAVRHLRDHAPVGYLDPGGGSIG